MKNNKFSAAAAALCLSLCLSGCGAASSADSFSNMTNMSAGAGYSASYDYESVDEGYLIDDEKEVSSAEKEFGDKLVYTCDITIETLEYENSLSYIRSKVTEYGGIIGSESESDDDYNWYYSDYSGRSATRRIVLEARIPSNKYDEFLNSLDGTGKVRSKTSNVENISKTYYDTAAIIESLEIQQDRLMDMMDAASTIDEMIQVEQRLTEVQMELNRNKTALAVMQTDVDYSTVTMTLEEVVQYDKPTDTFFDRLVNTFAQAFDDFKEILEGLVFFIILLIPRLIIFIPVILLITVCVKKFLKWKKRKAPADNKKEE